MKGLIPGGPIFGGTFSTRILFLIGVCIKKIKPPALPRGSAPLKPKRTRYPFHFVVLAFISFTVWSVLKFRHFKKYIIRLFLFVNVTAIHVSKEKRHT